MKSSIFLIFIALTLNSCLSFKHANIPKVKDIGTGYYGSYIVVKLNKGVKINNNRHVIGELIAVDNEKMIVFMVNEQSPQPEKIALNDIKRFSLYYAKGPNYSFTSLLPLSTITHGIFLIFTFPINLAVSIYDMDSAIIDFRYNQNNISFEKLKMFARFPQGIPPNVTLKDLKPPRSLY